ncbi:MAG: hypothetical protein U5L45_17385 [Saprospiraceae bacterium]|nr:hypothetical protein [Saprospiraceae bacterium]
MVRFSANPKNEPRLLPFARAKRAREASLGIYLWVQNHHKRNLLHDLI